MQKSTSSSQLDPNCKKYLDANHGNELLELCDISYLLMHLCQLHKITSNSSHFQEIEHIRQHDGHNGEIRHESGGHSRREDGTA